MNVSQRHNVFQFCNSLSTADNTSHIYGIGLNRNRMFYLKYQNGIQIRFPFQEYGLNMNFDFPFGEIKFNAKSETFDNATHDESNKYLPSHLQSD